MYNLLPLLANSCCAYFELYWHYGYIEKKWLKWTYSEKVRNFLLGIASLEKTVIVKICRSILLLCQVYSNFTH